MSQTSATKGKAVAVKPFIKWAGGKRNLLQQMEELLPTNFDKLENVTYIEPFVGGGAMLFHMLHHHKCIKRAVINDINPDLIQCYQLIARSPEVLIDKLSIIEKDYYSVEFPARKDLYYNYRDQYNSEGINPDERAALFIFLNRTCFNGLYRVNATGKFNVPYGQYKKPLICNKELIMADHQLLSSVELIIRDPGDYKLTRHNLSRDNVNFVYIDPPYRPLGDKSSFKEYSNIPFGDKQQEELKIFCDMLLNQNCLIMQSNSDSKTENGESYFDALYEGYDIKRILASRFINAGPEKRIKLNEVIIRDYRCMQ